MRTDDFVGEPFSVDELIAVLQAKLRRVNRYSRKLKHPPDLDRAVRILIIEDSPDIVEAVSLAFSYHWPEAGLISTPFGKQGIEIAAKEKPCAIILDLGLPDINGIEVLNRVRLFSTAPVIVLTIRRDEDTLVRALEAEATDYVIKPFRQRELIARVRAHVERWMNGDLPAPVDFVPTVHSVNSRYSYSPRM